MVLQCFAELLIYLKKTLSSCLNLESGNSCVALGLYINLIFFKNASLQFRILASVNLWHRGALYEDFHSYSFLLEKELTMKY